MIKLSSLPIQSSTKSDQAPIAISWIINSEIDNTNDQSKTNSSTYFSVNNPRRKPNPSAIFGICQCPGKKLVKGRDGKPHLRSIEDDINYFKVTNKIDMIICLLDRYELKFIGVDLEIYKKQCDKNNIELVCYPIIEMACPNDKPRDFDQLILDKIKSNIENGKRVIAHCRGGIGRAGTLACCMLLKLKLAHSLKQAVSHVREIRDPRCVESKKQMDYIEEYLKICKSEVLRQ